ncbi:MAG TPA: hypothetical protein PKC67_04145 [Kiritimatiellia bacterium]|nr:hypothetical protein [Kiritimatiellia bacterium]HMP33519.1 hypothetical protein [Kiritimatiellia bacterium]
MDTMTIAVAVVGLLTLVVLVMALTKIQALSKSIQRLSEQIPGTGATAQEIGAALGGSIESSFQKYMPQPEKVSAAISSSVEASLKTASAGVESMHTKMLASQGAVLEKWAAHEKNAGAGLEAIRKALEGATQQLGIGLTGGSDKMTASLDGGAKKLGETLGAVAAKLEASLNDHAEKTGKASAQLVAQLDKIAALEKEIDKLLHLQQSTEGTIKSVAASEEFKSLVKALRDHLQQSDAVLREVAKPRTIRLVESDT